MSAYGSSKEAFDDFEWEEELSFTSQQYEKFTERKSDSRKLRTRRQIEDIQERREHKKRVRLAMDGWNLD